MHHLNISLESLEPALYERMRRGARHAIFQANWELLLEAFADAAAPPPLRYNVMAYRSNLSEIPDLVEILLRDKRAWQVEIRHTYDEPHIPPEFRDGEFLTTAEWAWLADQLRGWPAERVLLLRPPGGVGHEPASAAAEPSALAAPDRPAAPTGIPRPLNISMAWDGALRVYGEEPRGPGQPPAHVNYVTTNISYLSDPLRFLLAL
jgi:transcriptional regulator of met regulon